MILFCFDPPKFGCQHLFLDGSCTVEEHSLLQLASWSVLSATTGNVVASGHLPGITQTIDRAEATALLSALLWGAHTDVELHLWLDSLSTVQVAHYLQKHDYVPLDVENYDIWHRIQHALHNRFGTTTYIHWIPSHLSAAMAEDAFEDWIIHWNGLVDHLAAHKNHDRPLQYVEHLSGLRRCFANYATRLRQLRSFFFKVADQSKADCNSLDDGVISISSGEENEKLWLPLADHLPLNWKVRCLHGTHQVPGQFLIDIVEWLCAAESQP